MLLYLIFFILILLFVKNIIDSNNNIDNSDIIYKKKLDDYSTKKIYNPLLLTHDICDTNIIKYINDNTYNYYHSNDNKLVRLSDFIDFNNIYIYNNYKLFNDLNINTSFIESNFFNKFTCNITRTASIFKGTIYSTLIKNKNTYNIIYLNHGILNINLYNPKHDGILNDTNKKKYSIQIRLDITNNLLFIPTNWIYEYNSDKITSFINLKSDNIFTYHYNLFR